MSTTDTPEPQSPIKSGWRGNLNGAIEKTDTELLLQDAHIHEAFDAEVVAAPAAPVVQPVAEPSALHQALAECLKALKISAEKDFDTEAFVKQRALAIAATDTALAASPLPRKVRMLTSEEFKRCCDTTSKEDAALNAIELFFEVNGLSLEGDAPHG